MQCMKLSQRMVDECRRNCLWDEIVVVPNGSGSNYPYWFDFGQEEYHNLKTEEMLNKIGLNIPADRCGLGLQFPSPDYGETEILYFFDSPSVHCRNQHIKFCFMVDITAYMSKRDHKYFKLFREYIRENEYITFMLLARTNNAGDVNRLYTDLRSLRRFEVTVLEQPSVTKLAEYTRARLRSECGLEEKEITKLNKLFTKLFNDRPDFSLADELVRDIKVGKLGLQHVRDGLERYGFDQRSHSEIGC